MNFILRILDLVNHFQNYVASSGLDLSQYGSYLYLLILAIVLIPAVVLGILQVRTKYYGVLVSVGMAVLLVWFTRLGMGYFLLFLALEIVLISVYSYIRKKKKNKCLYFLFLIASILPLLSFKASALAGYDFFGFLGISYLTFKAIQMIIEIYDGAITSVSIFRLFYFFVFFPTLSSGPIDRYRRFDEDINRKISRKDYLTDYLPNGIRKIVMGIGYKFVLAYLINTYWLTTIPADHSFAHIFSYMYAYSFFLFFDFAGYSNFAVGTSYILGVKTPNNFFLPFLSINIKEFWTRWHISLSKWFGDYLYSRITMNFMRKKLFKSKHSASYTAQVITMFTMGLWHGFQWYYLLYGLYHGLLLVISDFYERKCPLHKKNKDNFAYQCIQVFVTFNIVCFGFLIFSGYFSK